MAKKKHVAILEKGVEAWNQWREQNRNIEPDLSEANLDWTHISGLNLGPAGLFGLNFSKVNFSATNLMAVSLSRANLSLARLGGANLSWADLSSADLSGADLSGAFLARANLSLARLGGANFSGANLSWVDLNWADLSGADLSGADLSFTYFSETHLDRANFTQTKCSKTTFGNVDLSQVKGLETAEHSGPSYIDIATIYRSGGNISEAFLRGSGAPDNFITFMKSLTGKAFDFYSCFISHSSKDKEFVERLYADLQSNGVRCWYAPEDLKIGDHFPQSIDKSIRLHDKLLLVLSENSVSSSWVQDEVLSAMEKEQGKEPWVLFPIRIDDTVMETEVFWANKIRRSRHIGDFTQWKDHDSYKKAFDRLLRDLKGKS